jgi:phosphoglycolate phosphatase
MSRFKALIFDFDLTLCDSTEGFHECHRVAAEATGLPAPSREAAGRTIGTPLPLAYVQLYGESRLDLRDEYVKRYQARADEVMTELTVMLPQAPDALRALAASGYLLGIVSQKLRYRVEDVLRRDGLMDAFACILGGEDVPAFKPDPRGLLMAMDLLGATTANSLYTGDTDIDAEAARNAGLPFVGVLTGFGDASVFAPYAPLAVLPDVGGLPGFLSALK